MNRIDDLYESRWAAFGLATCRFISGGALLIASIMKLQNPTKLMLSIQSFDLLPEVLIPFFAYAVPWTELIAGFLLLYGIWSRAAAGVATLMYAAFTVGLASVILRDLPVDCGCFGGLFGTEEVGWTSIFRNLILIGTSLVVVAWGGGATALDRLLDSRVPEARLERISRSSSSSEEIET